MTQVQRHPRRRLFTRRELRHRGTHIVRVGSANIVESAQGPYSFAAVVQRINTSQTSQEDAPPDEPIEAFSQHSSADNRERAEDITDSDRLEQKSPPPVRRLTQVAQRTARKLLLSPTNRRRTVSVPQQRRIPQDVVLVSSDDEDKTHGKPPLPRTPNASHQILSPPNLTPLRLACNRFRPQRTKATPARPRPPPPPLYDLNKVKNVNSIWPQVRRK
ncbi:hypothetical protein IW150_000842 [Coemansia sp. RSA 2607]|nr:hypothetical protein IW150_000842 [Coemansia sp. RSA 2607]KAJ2395522.1 hypothetical protein GGI05_001546 [Coemansia sp. RSA 2603]